MKFFCEYCGNRIDSSKDNKCPNCGASYKKNKTFIELEKNKSQQDELNNEYKHKIISHVLGTMTFSKVFMMIPLVFFLIIFTTIIMTFLNFKNEVKNEVKNDITEMKDEFQSVINDESKEQEKITVSFNEFAETEKYKVKVEKYEVIEDTFQQADEGYELVKFHLIVENISDVEIRRENVNCIVDGIAQNNKLSSGYSDLPFFVEKELAVKGTSTFIVPINATSYDIRYGDYVTIHIQK